RRLAAERTDDHRPHHRRHRTLRRVDRRLHAHLPIHRRRRRRRRAGTDRGSARPVPPGRAIAVMGTRQGRRLVVVRTAVAAVALALWLLPPPGGLTLPAWRLFAVFATAIVSVVAGV